MAPRFLLALSILISTLSPLAIADAVSFHGEPKPNQILFGSPEHAALRLEDDFLELWDICIAASVDGRMYGLNRTSGQVLWTLPSSSGYTSTRDPPPSTLPPLVRTGRAQPHISKGGGEGEELYIIEPQSGKIYVLPHINSDVPLQVFPLTMSQLADKGEFEISMNGAVKTFFGKKDSSLLAIELETGRLQKVVNRVSGSLQDLPGLWNTHSESALDDLDGRTRTKSISASAFAEILILRTDYNVTITYNARKPNLYRPPPQHLFLSTYGPNDQSLYRDLQSAYTRTLDDAYIQSTPTGELYFFSRTLKNNVSERDSSAASQPLWMNTFGKPIVGVFDVLRTRNHSNTIALLQPKKHSHELFPDFKFNGRVSETAKNKAYVGTVDGSTSSLFAMSPENFPLVVFHRGASEVGRVGY